MYKQKIYKNEYGFLVEVEDMEIARKIKQNIKSKATLKDLLILVNSRKKWNYEETFKTKLYNIPEYCQILEVLCAILKDYTLKEVEA